MYILFGWKAQSLAQHSWFVGYLKFWFLSSGEGVSTVKTTVQIQIYKSFLKISHTNWYLLATEILSLKCDWNIPFFEYETSYYQLEINRVWNERDLSFDPSSQERGNWVFPFIVKISQWSILGQKGAHGINVVYYL